MDAPRYNAQTRVVAVLNGVTGRVTYLQRTKIGKKELPLFYAQVRAAYFDNVTFSDNRHCEAAIAAEAIRGTYEKIASLRSQ